MLYLHDEHELSAWEKYYINIVVSRNKELIINFFTGFINFIDIKEEVKNKFIQYLENGEIEINVNARYKESTVHFSHNNNSLNINNFLIYTYGISDEQESIKLWGNGGYSEEIIEYISIYERNIIIDSLL